MTEEYSKAMCNGKAIGFWGCQMQNWRFWGWCVTFGELGEFALLTDWLLIRGAARYCSKWSLINLFVKCINEGFGPIHPGWVSMDVLEFAQILFTHIKNHSLLALFVCGFVGFFWDVIAQFKKDIRGKTFPLWGLLISRHLWQLWSGPPPTTQPHPGSSPLYKFQPLLSGFFRM